jgi:hypothetical protein
VDEDAEKNPVEDAVDVVKEPYQRNGLFQMKPKRRMAIAELSTVNFIGITSKPKDGILYKP